MPHDSGTIVKFMDSTGVGAVGAAVEGSLRFDSVAYHFAAAVSTQRGEGVNRTLETVESM